MRTKFIICLGNGPDDIENGDGWNDSLESVQRFTSEKKARKEFERWVFSGATNMRVHLLRVEQVATGRGFLK